MRTRWLLSWLLLLTGSPAWSQCYTLHGTLTDAVTGKGVEAAFHLRWEGRRQKAGSSDNRGVFTIQIPCGEVSLLVEKSGYRLLDVPVAGDRGSYGLNLRLHPVDKQASDRPYFQSEQQDLVLDNAGVVRSGKTATRFFRLIDVETKTAVAGEVCLYYTKKEGKQCFAAGQDGKGAKIIFDQEDIIGVVATAKGYQTYNGQLQMDRLDNGSVAYDMALSRMMSAIAFRLEAGGSQQKAEIRNKAGQKLPVQKLDPAHGYAMAVTGETYRLKVSDPSGQFLRESLYPGIGGIVLVNIGASSPSNARNASPTTAADPIPALTSFAAPTASTILFSQGDYTLTTEARQTLDALAAWLAAHPEEKVKLTGHTDNVGDERRNLALSENRAIVAANYLLHHGAQDHQVTFRGVGGGQPAHSNEKEETKRLNRRVEISKTNLLK